MRGLLDDGQRPISVEVTWLGELFAETHPGGGWRSLVARVLGYGRMSRDDAARIEAELHAEGVQTIPSLTAGRLPRVVMVALVTPRPGRVRVLWARIRHYFNRTNATLAFVASGIAIAAFVWPEDSEEPSRMTGELNLAVAPFTGSADAGQRARGLTRSAPRGRAAARARVQQRGWRGRRPGARAGRRPGRRLGQGLRRAGAQRGEAGKGAGPLPTGGTSRSPPTLSLDSTVRSPLAPHGTPAWCSSFSGLPVAAAAILGARLAPA